ncbi:uncharacterized protein ighd isoform X3 [Boleophthalmus pectinirostris]|uniref:uncharacterized protein ighd isoform X3 n=1 Tax=Boleophthalmus pectinirostris TaxID=150288 RepID=UPI00242CEF34|nr:uncharacterized protein ighd isoform X3 [Boleophthalmus pectinirostris]
MDTLTLLWAALCLICVKCETLTQPTSVTVQPGHTLTIPCTVSYSVSSYYTAWIRQPAGKGLEWIGMKYTGGTHHKDSLKSKFSLNVDSSSNTVTLNGQNMQPGDTAVYYCARYHSGSSYDYFDYWGKGTTVTVTSATPTAPTVFPVIPCSSGSGDMVTLACLASGFSPSSVSFSWTRNGTAVADSIQYPSVLKDNLYSGVSQIRIKRDEWEQRQAFYKCKVDHAAGTKEVDFAKPKRQVLSPNITLYLSWEGDWDSQVKLTCLVSGFYPDTLKVSWTRDNHPFLDSTPIENKFKSPNGGKSFTLSSQIEPNMTEWENGSNFTCVALHEKTTYSKSINICKMTPKMPPAVDLETPSFQTVMTAESRVNATCTVRSVARTSVTWLLYPEFSAPQIIKESNSTHIISKLTLSPSQWETLFLLTCKAEHACLPPTEKSINISEPPASDPVVSIRRSLPDLLKGDRAVLECDITSVSSTDFYVTFQSNDVDISSKDFVQLPKGSGLHSISRRFSVPKDQWKNDQNFSCRVSYGFSTNFTSTPTGSIFVEPSVKLLLASDESGKQTLFCTAWGFDPHIQWLSGSQRISSGSNDSISVNAEGRVVVSSQLQVSQAEWKTGQVYTCQVSDKSLDKTTTLKEDISVCAVAAHLKASPVVLVELPSFQTVMTSSSNVTAICSVCTVFDATVSWWMGNTRAESHSVRQYMNSSHIISELTLPPSQWKTLSDVSCKAEHACFPTTKKTGHVAAPPGTSPVVSIRRSLPDLLKGDRAVLECDITSVSSADFYVTFQSNDVDISSKDFVQLPKGSGLHSISRRFSVPKDQWKNNQNFSCRVSYGFSTNFTSTLTGSIFVEPSVKLLLASDESGKQTLFCTAWGFDPHIQWLSGSQRISSGSNDSISVNAEGRVVVSSQLQVSQAEWKTGQVYTCQVSDKSLDKTTTLKEDISVCAVAAHLKASPVVLVELPSFQTVMTSSSNVTAICSVCTVFDATVSWWMGNTRAESHSVRQYMNSSHIISELTLPPSQWKTLSDVSCKAEHACFPTTKKTGHVAAPPGTSPVVSIRRSLPDLLKGDRAVLECDITSVSSADFYVTFQSNDVDISSKDFVQLPKGSGLHSISRRFSVPKDQWKNNQNFSCRVSYGFSTNFTSTLTGSIFVEPSVKLLLASDESGKQTLLCTAWGFDPHIQWLSGSQRISSGSNDSISVNAEGRVVVSSQLQVSQAEWKTGQVYTCQVSDKSLGKTVKENISVCAVTPLASKTVGIYIQGPPLEERQSTAPRLNVSCLLVGPSLDSFSVTWKVDEQIESGGVHTKAPVLHSNGTQTLESQLSLPAQDWNTHKLVTCEAKHLCSNLVFKAHTNKSKVQLPPTVTLTYPSLHERSLLDPMFLDCLVSGFYPPEVRIFWEKNGIRIPPSSQTNAPVWQDKDGVTYCTSSRLNISNTLDDNSTYACVVRHESSAAPFTETIGPVFASVTPTMPSAVLLRGDNELVCLVSGFNPAQVNISWFLDNSTQLHDHKTSEVLQGPDRKFSIQSRLRLTLTDMLPGARYTCRVTHVTATIDVHVMQKGDTDNIENCNFLDYLLHTDLEQDPGVELVLGLCVFAVFLPVCGLLCGGHSIQD